MSSQDIALLTLAVDAAHAAGRMIQDELATRSKGSLRGGAETKTSVTDLVTEVDRASERLITTQLLAARPDDSIVGEEDGEHSGTSDITWVIDPIDGTTNFVYGFGSYAISIAAERNGQAVAGVVHDPSRDETFSACIGAGATLNGNPIHSNQSVQLDDALIGTGFGYSASRRADQARLLPTVLPRIRDLRRAGAAALDLCFVASGRLDAYFEAGLQPWDRAAGLLIAAEAGCTHTDLSDIVTDDNVLVVGPPQLQIDLVALLHAAVLAADGPSQP